MGGRRRRRRNRIGSALIPKLVLEQNGSRIAKCGFSADDDKFYSHVYPQELSGIYPQENFKQVLQSCNKYWEKNVAEKQRKMAKKHNPLVIIGLVIAPIFVIMFFGGFVGGSFASYQGVILQQEVDQMIGILVIVASVFLYLLGLLGCISLCGGFLTLAFFPSYVENYKNGLFLKGQKSMQDHLDQKFNSQIKSQFLRWVVKEERCVTVNYIIVQNEEPTNIAFVQKQFNQYRANQNFQQPIQQPNPQPVQQNSYSYGVQHTNQRQQRQLIHQFNMIDSNNDGKLSPQELVNAYMKFYKIDQQNAQAMVNNVFIIADQNKDGYLDFEEYKALTLGQ